MKAKDGPCVCSKCGVVVNVEGEAITPPGWLGDDGLCYSCHLAKLLPNWAKNLDWGEGAGANARKCPKMGIFVLDCPSGPRLRETMLVCRGKIR